MARTKYIKSTFMFEEGTEQRFAEVPVETWPAKTARGEVVGKPEKRVDGYHKVSGTATYTFDVSFHNMAHARTLRCPHAHAKIRSIDTSEAEAMPGVLAIIHHGNEGDMPWYRDSRLFDTHLRYEGDEVACVAAESEAIADAAMKKIKVQYDVLDFGIDPVEVLEKKQPVMHDEGVLYRGEPEVTERGNVQDGFSAADVTVEGTFRTPVALHNPTEPHCSVANWEGNELTVWDSTQAVYSVMYGLVDAMKISSAHVKVHTPYMGGGFGSKLWLGKYTVMAALLAQRIGRPVRLALDRREMNLAVGNRPDSVQKVRIGAKSDGTLTAIEQETTGQVGAYPSGAQAKYPHLTMYKCDHVRTVTNNVYTNAGSGRPFRAPGDPQGFFSLDQMMDELAGKLGMDTLELMKKNYTDTDQLSGKPYSAKKLMECYDWGAKTIGWDGRKPAGSDEGPIKRGIGVASQIWRAGMGAPPAGVTCTLYSDGTLHAAAGTQDIGTGTYTVVTQILAEELELPMKKIHVDLGHSTDPQGPSSGGSMTTPSIAGAALHGARQIKEAVLEAAAVNWDVPVSSLSYDEGVVSGPDGKSMKLGEAARLVGEGTIVRTGLRAPNPDDVTINPFGAQFAEVEVDTMTGRVRVLRVAAAHDIGRVINVKTATNQVHGGVIQGLGFALMEERLMDPTTGRVITTNLHDYKLPTMLDTPDIKVHFVDYVDVDGNEAGVKGLGEPPHIPTAAAIANAVYNATGVRMYTIPMTPDRVLGALMNA